VTNVVLSLNDSLDVHDDEYQYDVSGFKTCSLSRQGQFGDVDKS